MATEKRLIDANELETVFRETRISSVFPNWRNMDILAKDAVIEYAKEVKRIVTDAPTVDAAEVVRCKDCCHYRKATDWDGNSYYACHKRAAVLIMETKADDFCSHGERRTEC